MDPRSATPAVSPAAGVLVRLRAAAPLLLVALAAVPTFVAVAALLRAGAERASLFMGGSAEALPAYNLELSAAPAPDFPRWNRVRLRADADLSVVVRPATPVEGAVEARAFFKGDDRAWRPFSARFEHTARGTFIARRQALPATAGSRHLAIAVLVGRPAALPLDPGRAERLPASADWFLLDGEIEIDPP